MSQYELFPAEPPPEKVLSVWELTAQIKSYTQSIRNANDGMSVLQTSEASLNETANILTRLRELAMESASDGIGASERGYIQTEASQLLSEVDRIAQTTKFNGTTLLSGVLTTLSFHVGVNDTTNDVINFNNIDATTSSLGVNTIDLSTLQSSSSALTTIDNALLKISTARATIGAVGNRFQSTINDIQAFSEALSSANSRIMDVDVAEETSAMARANILQQAGVSVLAQANQQPQLALKLLQ